MPLQNRVTPTGDIIATAHRGLFTGNRGIIHDPATKTLLKKRWSSPAWITCVCEFRGWRRKVMGGRSWTELFFLDEATAFAAGHRPCFFCRREDANRFRAAWEKGNGVKSILAREMDAVFRRVVVRDKQRIVVEPVRWERAELIRTNTDGSTRAHFQRNEAVRRNQIAVPASVGQALSRIELSVYAPNFRKGKLGPVVKSRWHRARPAVASPPWHRSIRGRSDAICRG